MNTYYNGEIGVTENGNADALNQGNFYSFASGPYSNANRMGVGAIYTVGTLTGRVSYITADQSAKNTRRSG